MMENILVRRENPTKTVENLKTLKTPILYQLKHNSRNKIMAQKKLITENRGQRLRLPKRLEQYLPKIHWALTALRHHRPNSDFKWVQVKQDEQTIQPFTSIFDEQTAGRIEKLVQSLKPPQGSRSTLINTALHYYETGPNHNEPDKGLR